MHGKLIPYIIAAIWLSIAFCLYLIINVYVQRKRKVKREGTWYNLEPKAVDLRNGAIYAIIILLTVLLLLR